MCSSDLEKKECLRAGLLATQGIRGGANRAVLKRIKETGGIFFAVSDREWILAGANVHVSMVGFDDGSESDGILDGVNVTSINANLTAHVDTVGARRLSANEALSYIGASVHGPFAIPAADALRWLNDPNPNGAPNSDVVRPWANALTITARETDLWIVDVPPETEVKDAAYYQAPFKYLQEVVLPVRKNKDRKSTRLNSSH